MKNGKHKENSKIVLAASLIAALGGLLFGYDWVVVGGAKFFYERYFEIQQDTTLKAWAMSSALVGCIPGAMLAGYISDSFGRKLSLIIAAVLFTISAYGTGIADTFSIFLIYRAIGGVGIGLASSVAPIYIAEIAPASKRGKFVSINQFTIVIGILLAQIVNFLIADKVPDEATDQFILTSWNGQIGWRWMFWAECIPAAAFLFLSFFIPESPRWLIRVGKNDKAKAVLSKLNQSEETYTNPLEVTAAVEKVSFKEDLKFLSQRKYRWVLLTGFVLAALQQWCGINIVFNYAEEVFSGAGFGVTSSLYNIIITGVVNVLFTLIAMRVVDNWGRKKLMLFGFLGLSITYVLLGFSYFLGMNGMLVLVFITAGIGIYAMSLAPITWVVLSEIFPNKIRGAAMAAATGVLWIASTLLVLFFPWINKTFNLYGAFWIYAVICFGGFLFVRQKLIETKGKSLEELEAELIQTTPKIDSNLKTKIYEEVISD